MFFTQAAPILDSLLFKTFREAFGGRVRFIVSGGAPLATHVEQFLSVTLCAPVFQASGHACAVPNAGDACSASSPSITLPFNQYATANAMSCKSCY